MWDGVYTDAGTGRRAAVRPLTNCHGNDLEGIGIAPPLVGDAFLANWDGKSLGDLFDLIRTDMPNDDPGSLSPREYADYLAYILNSDKFPAGKTELKPDQNALDQVGFEARKL